MTANIKPLLLNSLPDSFLLSGIFWELTIPKSRKTKERKEIIKTIENAAKVYKDQLVGKTFLYVFDGRYIEVMFKAENF